LGVIGNARKRSQECRNYAEAEMPALRSRAHGLLPRTLGKKLVDVCSVQYPVGRRRIRLEKTVGVYGDKGAAPRIPGAAPLSP